MCVVFSLKKTFLAFLCVIGTSLLLGKSISNSQTRSVDDPPGRHPFDILYDPEAKTQNATDTRVDIIAVHGLGSNVDRTWTWRGINKTQEPVNWLKDADMLQSKIPNARILAFNYDSTWLSDAPRTRVELCGEDLVHSLHRLRPESDRPTVFIGHSFGGLVIQDVVEESSACLAGDERSHLQTNHLNLNKYPGPGDRSFISVSHQVVRMCEDAMRQTREKDLDPTHSIHKGHWVVPFDRNEGFVGRDNILPDLLGRISPDRQKDACQRTVVEGLGGIGKSQIALEAAFCLRDSDPTCSIFWVPAFDITSFENAYRDIAQVLGVQHADNERSDIFSLVKQALSDQEARKWLLIVDNADDPSLVFEPGSLASYLPSSPKGSILFTTRTSEITSLLDVPSVGIFRIDAMSPQESMDLMGTRLSTSQMEDSENLHALLGELFYLPLAIKQAAAYMQQTRETPKRYLDLCRDSDKNLIILLSQGFQDRTRYEDAQNPVAKTWLISFVHLWNNNPLAGRYLNFMSFLSEKNIPLSILPILPPRDELESNRAIGALQAYGFVTAREDRKFVDMHRLVRLAIRNWLEDRGQDKETYGYVQAHMLLFCDAKNYGNKAEWARNIPHCQTVVDEDALSTSTQAAFYLLLFFSDGLVWRGMQRAALDLSRRAKSLSMAINDPDNLRHIKSMSSYAVSLIMVGHSNEAEEILRETLPRQERGFGKHHHKTLESRRNLAVLLLMRGQYKEAEKMCRELLQETERALGKWHEQTILAACGLCRTLRVLRKYEEAEKIARQLLVQSRSIPGDQQSTVFVMLENLADLLRGLEQFQEAEELTRQAINIVEIMLGKEHPKTLRTTASLAGILYQSGQLFLAEELSQKLVKAQERILGKEDPETLRSANTLAATLCGLERFLEAEDIFRDNLQAYQRLYGEGHGETILSAIDLGSCLRLAGKHREAVEVLQQTVEISSKINNIPNDGQSFLIDGAEVYHSSTLD
ncbi:hypothetical protein HG530_006494 [Fusarium avenaceum]|nr:hypothetical protein HG530_006494 [Fusarium avenaceum]